MVVGNGERLIRLPDGIRPAGVTSLFCLSTLIMGVFDSRPLNAASFNNRLRKSPLLFGAPFLMIMVVASYALVPFVQTKYDLQDRRVSKVRLLLPQKLRVRTRRGFQVTKEQELGLENRRRKFDIREEYFASVSIHLRLDPPDLPSVHRNSVQRLQKIGSPNVSNVRPEHLNGAYPHMNLRRSSCDPSPPPEHAI